MSLELRELCISATHWSHICGIQSLRRIGSYLNDISLLPGTLIVSKSIVVRVISELIS